MAIEKVIQIKASTKDAEKNLKDVNSTLEEQREILIDLEKELIKVEQLQKDTSKSNLSAQRNLTEQANHLKDSIKDQKLSLRSLNIERREASNVVKTLNVDNFESTKVFKLLDTFTGGYASKIKGLYQGFKEGVKGVKSFNIGLKGMKTALISTGIGALVVALGLVVAYWDDIVEFIGSANKKLEEQHTLLTENLGVIDSELGLLKKKEKFNTDNGISNEENLKKQKEILLEKQKLIKEDVKILEAQLLKEQSVSSELSLWQKFQLALGNVPDMKLIDEEETKRISDLKKQINALKGFAIETNQAILDIDNTKESENTIKREKQTVLGGALTSEEQAAELEKKQKQFEEIFELEAVQKQALVDLNKSALDAISNDKNIKDAEQAENDKKYSEIRKKQIEDEANLKMMLQQQSLTDASNTFNQIAQIAGKDSKIGKAMAIASATISGVQGVQNAYSTAQKSPITTFFPAYPVVQAALAGVVAAKNIAAIKSVNPQSGGGSSSVTSTSASQAAAPQFNIVGQGGTNQLAESIGSQTQQPVQAYVVSNDVTTAQSMQNNIVQGASIG